MLNLDGEYLKYGDDYLRYVPAPEVAPTYLRFVIPSVVNVRPLASEVDLSLFDVVSLGQIEPLIINFPDDIGFPAFALKVGVPLMQSWYISVLNNGRIGGSGIGYNVNLFPDPVLIPYNGFVYRVYWTSYITQIKEPIQIWK
jgi:hypothetical protein